MIPLLTTGFSEAESAARLGAYTDDDHTAKSTKVPRNEDKNNNIMAIMMTVMLKMFRTMEINPAKDCSNGNDCNDNDGDH